MNTNAIKLRFSSWVNLEVIKSPALSKALGISIFIILTSLGAFVYIPLPFTPVPITLQTFFVILSGAFLGPWAGSASQAGYLTLGALGLPIFSGGRGGIIHLLGPSGGYIWGFILASWVAGKVVYGKKRTPCALFSYFLLGIFIIYLFGIAQLLFFVRKDFSTLFRLGVLPFILPDIFKAFFAVLVFAKVKK